MRQEKKEGVKRQERKEGYVDAGNIWKELQVVHWLAIVVCSKPSIFDKTFWDSLKPFDESSADSLMLV